MKDGMGEKKDQSDKPGAPKKGFELDDVLKEVLGEDLNKGTDKPLPGPGTPAGQKAPAPPERIERVSELVEGDFEEVSEEEPMGPKDEAIQNYIMDLEADLEEKMAALETERNKRALIESEAERLKKDLEKAQKEEEADETVQGYLSDLESDLKVKMEDLENERKDREKLEKELAEMRSRMDGTLRSQDEVAKLKSELDWTKAKDDVEIARLEADQKRREQETESFKMRVSELEAELKRKVALIEDMRSKTSETEACVIDFKERVRTMEKQLESERIKGKDANGRAEELASELQKMRDVLSTKVQEVEKAKTDLHSLETMKKRLDDASHALDKESKDRVRAESEIDKLRGGLSDIMQNMQSDLAKYRDGHEKALKDLEAERSRKVELENEIQSLKTQIDSTANKSQKELSDLQAERDRLKMETMDRQRAIESEMLRLNVLKEELEDQRRVFEQEKSSVDAMRARTEKELSERSSEYAMKDVRLRAEFDGLKHEKDQLEKKNYELAQKEARLVQMEQALKERETKLRDELRSKALGLSSPTEEAKPPEGNGNVIASDDGPGSSNGPGSRTNDLDETTTAVEEDHASYAEAPVEEAPPVRSGPRIWPPLSSMKGRGSEGDVEPGVRPRPEVGPTAEMRSSPKREPKKSYEMGLPRSYTHEQPSSAAASSAKSKKRKLHWPDSAYEAEARVSNVSYEPEPSEDRNAAVPGKRRLINNYVSAKSGPTYRPTERRIRCVCGAEIWATTVTPDNGILCPRCGRRIL